MASPPRKVRRQSAGQAGISRAEDDWQVTEADFEQSEQVASENMHTRTQQAQDAGQGEDQSLGPVSPEATDTQAPEEHLPEVQDEAMMTETVKLARDEAEARMKGIFQMVMHSAGQFCSKPHSCLTAPLCSCRLTMPCMVCCTPAFHHLLQHANADHG